MPKLPFKDKFLQAGPSSSLTGELYRVMNVLRLEVKHKGCSKPAVTVNYPIIVMTPDTSVLKSFKTKVSQKIGYNPYQYSLKELYLTAEEEDLVPYLSWRKDFI